MRDGIKSPSRHDNDRRKGGEKERHGNGRRVSSHGNFAQTQLQSLADLQDGERRDRRKESESDNLFSQTPLQQKYEI